MDNQMMISMIGSTAPAREKARAGDTGNADAFTRELEKATAGSSTAAGESEKVIADKPKDKARDKDARSQEGTMEARLEQQQTARRAAPGSREYLYQMAYRNKDTMSLAERQALRLETPDREGVALQELRQMLSERGLNLRQLSFSQIAQMTRHNDRSQVASFLDYLAAERESRERAPETEGARRSQGESIAQAASATEMVEHPYAGQAALVQEAQRSQTGAQAEQARRRRQVIDEILQHIQVRNLADRDEIQLKLNPEYLGELRILLTQNKEGGGLTARFETTSRTTRQLLTEGQEELREMAGEKGLHLGQVEIALVDGLEGR
ncbi:MAG TPA: flagellar hook-length control protein FliK [Candidatus Nitrosotenuis sp.]|nr:flagellar hook-length control protein FliK [Candidatus Nitrosotenuis sp.]